MSALTIANTTIREQDGLYSLNDLHIASGGAERHKPHRFMRLEQAQALIAQIELSGDQNTILCSDQRPKKVSAAKILNGGTNPGTWACRELVIAYAAWINAAFHLKVIRVFLAQATAAKEEPKAPSLLNRRWLISYDFGGSEKLQEVGWDECVLRYRDLPNLLADSGNPIASELLAQIGAVCIERLSRRVSTLSLQKLGQKALSLQPH